MAQNDKKKCVCSTPYLRKHTSYEKYKMKNTNLICHMPYLMNSIAYYHGFWYPCVKWYLQGFFSFFQSWFLGLFGVKGQKWPKLTQKGQNDKNVCLLCSISQEPFIIWFSLMVHMFKMMIFPEFFFIFSKFWFFRLLGMSEVEKWPKITKNSFCHALYLRNHTSYHLHVWCICVKG